MQAITENFGSFYEKEEIRLIGIRNLKRDYKKEKSWETIDASVSKVRRSSGYPIKDFKELVEKVAYVTLWNREYDMFYRGQDFDHKDKTGKTIIYPTICRPEKNSEGKYKASIRTSTIESRFDKLNNFIEFYDKKAKYLNEYYISLIQHYEILPTPLIDITQSLRVAATFALNKGKTGYVYVFGLPYPNGSISHFIDRKITLVKLQNVSHPKAFRPRYQEGFLVGRLPFKPIKEAGDNLARRLIAKFYIDNLSGNFWDKNFTAMPYDLLFPPEDEYKRTMQEKHEKFATKYGS